MPAAISPADEAVSEVAEPRSDSESEERRKQPAQSAISLFVQHSRWAFLATYIVYMGWHWDKFGVPIERLQVFAWAFGGILITIVGRPGPNRWPNARSDVWQMALDWVPMGILLAIYDLTRGLADSLGVPVQVRSVISIERALFGDTIPSVALQEKFVLGGGINWWELPIAMCYFSHFIFSFALLGVLWVKSRKDFIAFRRRFGLLTLIGLTGYLILPTAPPWMASGAGEVGQVHRIGIRGFRLAGWSRSEFYFQYGSQFSNRVAAMPSLHGGWSMLLALFLTRYLPKWAWPLLFAYPAFMMFSLVFMGEHYVVDVLAGFACAAASMLVIKKWESDDTFAWWEQRSAP